MEYYTYYKSDRIVEVQFENSKKYILTLEDFFDETTDVFDETYGDMETFAEYLFCNKYSFIPHEIIE